MAAVSAGTGRVSVSERDALFTPTAYRRDGSKVGIIAVHGSGADGHSPVTTSLSGTYRLHRLLAQYYPIVATDLGGPSTWGNLTAQTRIAEAKTYLQGTLGAKAGPVILVAISMGNIASHNYARNNPGEVLGIVASIGASNLTQLYGGAFQSSIAAAWGITPGDPLPAGADPLLNPYSMPNYVNYYDGADTVVLPQDAVALASLVSGEAIEVSNFNHSEAAVAAIPEQHLLDTFASWIS